MEILQSIIFIVIGYLLGAIPMGYVTIGLFKKQDITNIGSGRTGGTNAMRAGGVWIGVITALLDLLKGFLAVWLVQQFMPGVHWTQALAGAASVAGHNWSLWLFLLTGKLSAGAGTGPNVGAAMAFWPGIILVGVPTVLFFVFVVGYASLASMATALAVIIVFVLRWYYLGTPWEYIVFSILTAAMIFWALRPNIQRLLNGTERRVGLFARSIDRAGTENNHSSSSSSS